VAKKGEIQILKVDASGYGLFEGGERGGDWRTGIEDDVFPCSGGEGGRGAIDEVEGGIDLEGVEDLIDGPRLADVVLYRDGPVWIWEGSAEAEGREGTDHRACPCRLGPSGREGPRAGPHRRRGRDGWGG